MCAAFEDDGDPTHRGRSLRVVQPSAGFACAWLVVLSALLLPAQVRTKPVPQPRQSRPGGGTGPAIPAVPQKRAAAPSGGMQKRPRVLIREQDAHYVSDLGGALLTGRFRTKARETPEIREITVPASPTSVPFQYDYCLTGMTDREPKWKVDSQLADLVVTIRGTYFSTGVSTRDVGVWEDWTVAGSAGKKILKTRQITYILTGDVDGDAATLAGRRLPVLEEFRGIINSKSMKSASVSYLLRGLAAGSTDARMSAAAQLGIIGSESPDDREAAISSLKAALTMPIPEPFWQGVYRAKLAGALVRLGEGTTAWPILLYGLPKTELARLYALPTIRGLGALGEPAVDRLVEALDLLVREQESTFTDSKRLPEIGDFSDVAWTLGSIGPAARRSAPFLIGLVKNSRLSDLDRGAALNALVEIDPASAQPFLIPALKEQNYLSYNRTRFVEYLAEVDPESAAPWLDLLIDGVRWCSEWTRPPRCTGPIVALGFMGKHAMKALPLLRTAAENLDQQFSQAARTAIGKIEGVSPAGK